MKKNRFNWFMLQGVGASCWFMWTASTFLSYWGFTQLAPNAPWWVKVIALGVSGVINFVEYMGDNFSWHEFWFGAKFMRDYILRVFWVVCYAYDIYTNVIGFISVVGIPTASIIMAFRLTPTMAVFASLFGIMLAIGPEPLYIWFLENNFKYPAYVPSYMQTAKQYSKQPDLYPASKVSKPTYSQPNTGMKTLGGMTPADFLEKLKNKGQQQ